MGIGAAEFTKRVVREAMLTRMSDWSEREMCAGWYGDLELIVRRSEDPYWLAWAVLCAGWPQGYMAMDGWEEPSEEEMKRFIDLASRGELPEYPQAMQLREHDE